MSQSRLLLIHLLNPVHIPCTQLRPLRLPRSPHPNRQPPSWLLTQHPRLVIAGVLLCCTACTRVRHDRVVIVRVRRDVRAPPRIVHEGAHQEREGGGQVSTRELLLAAAVTISVRLLRQGRGEPTWRRCVPLSACRRRRGPAHRCLRPRHPHHSPRGSCIRRRGTVGGLDAVFLMSVFTPGKLSIEEINVPDAHAATRPHVLLHRQPHASPIPSFKNTYPTHAS